MCNFSDRIEFETEYTINIISKNKRKCIRHLDTTQRIIPKLYKRLQTAWFMGRFRRLLEGRHLNESTATPPPSLTAR
jgi:hypothetical protein